ncbi:MAG: hypothetical protein R6W83_07280 [Cryobacterium sp.]
MKHSGMRQPGARSRAAAPRRPLVIGAVIATIALVIGVGLTTLSTTLNAPVVDAGTNAIGTVDTADFVPGTIISDYNFFNSDALTESGVQNFLEGRDCRPRDGSPCLWEYRETTVTQEAVGAGHCARYEGEQRQRASAIIHEVAQACGVSPKVLLVLLQKEQSLLTTPNASGYLRATGYACPDTADCDTDYLGFFNQVYNAAWQFRQYTQQPDRAYAIGTVPVGFFPDQACGSTPVNITNQATANLYNYTPYQPSAGALAGNTDDGCATYGNLNFWKFYTQWFGDPDTLGYPSFFDQCLNLVGGQPCRAAALFE